MYAIFYLPNLLHNAKKSSVALREGLYYPSAEQNRAKSAYCPAPVLTPGHTSPRSPDCKGRVLSVVLFHFGPSLIPIRDSMISVMPAYQCPPICLGRISRQAGNRVFRLLRAYPGCIWRIRL